ncbi:hypothetical protein [Micromonospora jinlongensis]|nr:hypothetical protein [Micromonospora jinlongensis]
MKLLFRGSLPPDQYSRGSFSAIVGLGNGQTAIKRIKLSETQLSSLTVFPASNDRPNTSAGIPAMRLAQSDGIESPTSYATLPTTENRLQLLLLHTGESGHHQAVELQSQISPLLRTYDISMDLGTDVLGVDPLQVARRKILRSDVILVLVDESWPGCLSKSQGIAGRDHAKEEAFLVALRLSLAPELHTIPVLVAGARHLRANELDDDLQGLALRNPVDLSGDDHTSNLQRLLEHLSQHAEKPQPTVERPNNFRMSIDYV